MSPCFGFDLGGTGSGFDWVLDWVGQISGRVGLFWIGWVEFWGLWGLGSENLMDFEFGIWEFKNFGFGL